MIKRRISTRTIVLIIINVLMLSITYVPALSQEKADSSASYMKDAVRIYLDCPSCDEQFIRKELTFVNFVRDRNESQVHIFVTKQTTGSGGVEYVINFIGQQEFTGVNDTLQYHSKQADSDEITRKGYLQVMKLGLVKYAAKTPLASKLTISFVASQNAQEQVKDKWDYWVFSLRLNGNFNGQQRTRSTGLNSSISANRVTPALKINASANMYEYKSRYEVDDTTTLESYSVSRSFSDLTVFSLSDHWSTGVEVSISSSTFSNNDYSIYLGPAIEYDLFPYSEATHKQLRFVYTIGYNYKKYIEETIYEKTYQSLLNENLELALKVKQTWGSISTSIAGSHYFHDFKKYRVEVWGSISLNLFEGISLEGSGSWSSVHDQLGLRKGTATHDEVLLQQRQLETQYEYYVWFGISYSFGSIFNNVVNPRFGN